MHITQTLCRTRRATTTTQQTAWSKRCPPLRNPLLSAKASISRLQGVGQAGLTPLNLRYIQLYLSRKLPHKHDKKLLHQIMCHSFIINESYKSTCSYNHIFWKCELDCSNMVQLTQTNTNKHTCANTEIQTHTNKCAQTF